MGFVEKFVKVMRLPKKNLLKYLQKLWRNIGHQCGHQYCTSIPSFKICSNQLLKKEHIIVGSKFVVKSLKAQTSTLFDEVIYNFLDSTSLQFVVVALVRAEKAYRNKHMWELFVFKNFGVFHKNKIG